MGSQKGLVQRIERKLEATVGDAFARVFGGSIVPQEVETMLRREATDGVRSLQGNRLLAPNEYVITLGVQDYEIVAADPDLTSDTFAKHLAGYIGEQGWQTYGDVVVRFEPSPNLHTGQFRARGAVNPDAAPRPTAGDFAPPELHRAFSAEPGVPLMTDNSSYRGGQGQGRPGDDYYDDRYGPPQGDPRGGQEARGYPSESGGYPPQSGYPSARPAEHGGHPDQGAYPEPGGYPDQGGYPERGNYPEPGGYPDQRGYQDPGGYPEQRGGYPEQRGYPPQGGYPEQGGYQDQGRYAEQRGYPEQGGYPERAPGGYQQPYEQRPPGGYGGGQGYDPGYRQGGGYGPPGGQPGYGDYGRGPARQDDAGYNQPEQRPSYPDQSAGYDQGYQGGQGYGRQDYGSGDYNRYGDAGGGGVYAPPGGGYSEPAGGGYSEPAGGGYGEPPGGYDFGHSETQMGSYGGYGQGGYPASGSSVTLQLDDGSGRTYQLREGANIVGRGQDAQFRLPDTGVSRRHLEIRWDGQVALLSDLNSTNGTTVNNSAVQEWQLADGDVIRLGHSEIIVHFH